MKVADPDSKQNGMWPHWHQVLSAANGDMFGATNLTCGDWWASTVMDTLRWVKCPAKTSKRGTSLIMEKTATAPHKSHMSRVTRLLARWVHAVRGRRVMTHAAGAVARIEAAARQGDVAACMVDTSLRPAAGARHGRRPAVETVADDGGDGGIPGAGGRPAGRGPLPARKARAARCRALGKRRGACFAADGTGIRGENRVPWLSLCESLRDAQDLLLTTLSNTTYAYGNIFEFVTT